MCSSCGGGSAASRIPGGVSQNPIVFGKKDKRPAQPVTLLQDEGRAKAGTYIYAAGDGVEKAVEDGKIQLGYVDKAAPKAVAQRSENKPPGYYVKTGVNKWVGFKNRAAADRYAKTVGSIVETRDELLFRQGGDL